MGISVNKRTLNFVWTLSGTQNASATCGPAEEGWLKCLHITNPSMSANTSGTARLYDKDGKQLWSSTTSMFSAAATSALTGMELPVVAGNIFEMRLAAIPGCAAGVSAVPLTGTWELWLAL